MAQTDRTLQDTVTSLAPADVIAAAKRFFARRNSVYTAFVDMEGPTFLTLRGAGGEEIAIGTSPQGDATLVTGSTYLFDQQVARFLATLPAPGDSTTRDIPEMLSASTDPRVRAEGAV